MPDDESLDRPWLQLWLSKVDDRTRASELQVRDSFSPIECDRLERIGSSKRAREFLLSRALMRHALCQQFGGSAADWAVDASEGPPTPRANLPDGIHLSLSHSGGFICFAIANGRVGVDIERSDRRRRFDETAAQFMNPDEQQQFADAQAHRVDYFFRCWCAKEAAYKQLGQSDQNGVSLKSIDYHELLAGSGRRQLLEAEGNGLVMAVVTEVEPQRIDVRDYLVTVPLNLR